MTGAQPGPSADQVRSVEEKLGVSLPASYVKALAVIHGARPEENFIEDKGERYGVTRFLRIDEIPTNKRFIDEYNLSDRIPIASAPCGDYICIGTSHCEEGQIFILDHEFAGSEAFTKIADSLEDFLNRLQPAEPLQIKPVVESVWIRPGFLESLKKGK